MSGVPDGFVAKLFGQATPEDLRHCSAADLADIAEQSWSFLAERRPETPKIRFEPLAGAHGRALPKQGQEPGRKPDLDHPSSPRHLPD